MFVSFIYFRCAPSIDVDGGSKTLNFHSYNVNNSNVIHLLDSKGQEKITYLKCDIVYARRQNSSHEVNSSVYEKEKCSKWVYDKDVFDTTFAMQVSKTKLIS